MSSQRHPCRPRPITRISGLAFERDQTVAESDGGSDRGHTFAAFEDADDMMFFYPTKRGAPCLPDQDMATARTSSGLEAPQVRARNEVIGSVHFISPREDKAQNISIQCQAPCGVPESDSASNDISFESFGATGSSSGFLTRIP